MKDEKGYLERMEKSMQEKLFFIEHIDLNNKIVIDFGCADGTLVRNLKSFGYKDTLWLGVEANDTFRDQADEVLNYSFPSLLELYKFMRTRKEIDAREVVLITSSVLHECGLMLQYDLVNFAQLYCDYWTIRDMYYSIFGYVPALEYWTAIIKHSDKDQLVSFLEHKRVRMDEERIAEWLLKYRYVENWETEDWIPTYGDISVVGGGEVPTYTTTIINTYSRTNTTELPNTGGSGPLIYILCGLILVLGPFVYGLSLRRKYGRRSKR